TGVASAARPKHTTGTVARIDWPADDSPRSGSTGGISPIAVRMLNAIATTLITASPDRGTTAARDGRESAGSRIGARLMEGKGRAARPLPSCRAGAAPGY